MYFTSQGRADIEIRNNRQQTPLLLAVAQGHMPIIELLIQHGANINVEDEDGDSCLHLSLMKQPTSSSDMETTPMMEAVSLYFSNNIQFVHGFHVAVLAEILRCCR